jgi:hypothetical protein
VQVSGCGPICDSDHKVVVAQFAIMVMKCCGPVCDYGHEVVVAQFAIMVMKWLWPNFR